MSYSKNPFLPKVRLDAVRMVRSGKGIRETSRYFGVQPSTISRWVKRAPDDLRKRIPTKSSRPHSHPNEISGEIQDRILHWRLKTNRCAEVIHKHLENEGVKVSLSTVKRVLKRAGLTKEKSKWKKIHKYLHKPEVKRPGDLVQIDTIHMTYPGSKKRIYVYTLLDVYSRWAYAWSTPKIGAAISTYFVKELLKSIPFKPQYLQSDHGPEFSSHFTREIEYLGVRHRHIHVRSPNENGHLERFNRTIQEECLYPLPHSSEAYNQAIDQYIPHYNHKRLHLGIDLKTPMEMIRCCEAID